MNVRIFRVRVMECMCAQTRPQFISHPKQFWGNGVRTHVNSMGKIPCTGGSEEVQTLYAVSHTTASPTHYQLSYSGSHFSMFYCIATMTMLNGQRHEHLSLFACVITVEEAGGRVLPCIADIRFEDQVERAVAEAVKTFGGIDILVNNASAISLTGTLQTPMKRYDLMNGINARGTYLW